MKVSMVSQAHNRHSIKVHGTHIQKVGRKKKTTTGLNASFFLPPPTACISTTVKSDIHPITLPEIIFH